MFPKISLAIGVALVFFTVISEHVLLAMMNVDPRIARAADRAVKSVVLIKPTNILPGLRANGCGASLVHHPADGRVVLLTTKTCYNFMKYDYYKGVTNDGVEIHVRHANVVIDPYDLVWLEVDNPPPDRAIAVAFHQPAIGASAFAYYWNEEELLSPMLARIAEMTFNGAALYIYTTNVDGTADTHAGYGFPLYVAREDRTLEIVGLHTDQEHDRNKYIAMMVRPIVWG